MAFIIPCIVVDYGGCEFRKFIPHTELVQDPVGVTGEANTCANIWSDFLTSLRMTKSIFLAAKAWARVRPAIEPPTMTTLNL